MATADTGRIWIKKEKGLPTGFSMVNGSVINTVTTDFALLGDSVTNADLNLSPITKENHYINNKSASKTTTGYSITITGEGEDVGKDEGLAIIKEIGMSQSTGNDAERLVIQYNLEDKVTNSDSKELYKGYVLNATCTPDVIGRTGGEVITISYTISGVGDMLEGVMNVTDNTFTVGKASTFSLRSASSSTTSTTTKA